MSEMNIFDPHIPTEIMDDADKVADFCGRNGNEGWELGRVADRTAFVKANDKIDSLQRQLAEANTELDRHKQLLMELSVDPNSASSEFKPFFDRAQRSPVYWQEIARLAQDDLQSERKERDKFQYVVEEMRKALEMCFKEMESDDGLEHYDNVEMSRVLALSLDSIPHLYTEEEVKPLVEALRHADNFLATYKDHKSMTDIESRDDFQTLLNVQEGDLDSALTQAESVLSTFQRKKNNETRS